MSQPSLSHDKSSDNLISLYSRIPDYSEVKHLGHSEFINALEQLKEEFRRCRASLYHEDSSNSNGSSSTDVDFITDRTSKVLNIHSSSFNRDRDNLYDGKFTNVTQTNLSTVDNLTRSESNNDLYKGYLSVKGCELHRNPFASSGATAANYVNFNKPSRSLSFNFGGKNNHNQTGIGSAFYERYENDDDDELNSGTETPNSDFSKWSSSPDLYSAPYVPPSNVEKRLLQRKSQNNSAPSLTVQEEDRPVMFKANPVPSHVYKPLYDFIMLKNQRRSQKVREQSKNKLMAQVKPFSFARDTKSANGHKSTASVTNLDRGVNKEVLNNARPVKSRRNCVSGQSNKTINFFKANPAPPRTKALMSAMRLKEQQEYRELKKRLRAEALLKNATLPPSMAARDKRTKLTNAKLDALLQDYQNSYNSAKDNDNSRNYREHSTGDETVYTDEDRISEDSYHCQGASATSVTTARPHRKSKNFTPYGKSRHSAGATGVFECTSNDNLASRLRIQATRKRETERMRREEDELLKLMRNEHRRKKLRDSHIQAWRRAHSYSSSQDIAMRRQLRMAASILERESFIRDMSNMLSRVRSAPLLLEGLRERKFEPCKKHKEEFLQLTDRPNNKTDTPRFPLSSRSHNRSNSNWICDRYAEERSETAALAEGSLTNSDNESVRNIQSDSEDECSNDKVGAVGKGSHKKDSHGQKETKTGLGDKTEYQYGANEFDCNEDDDNQRKESEEENENDNQEFK